MSATFILFLVLGAAAGGFINGLAGTATALFALGFYLVVLDPVTAVAIVAGMAIISGVQGLWIVRSGIMEQPRRILRYMIPGLLGVPLGILVLDRIDASTLRLFIAGLLIFYGAYFGFRSALPAFSRHTPVLDGLIGLIGGFLGGAASLAGAVPSMWMSLRPWTKAEMRVTLQSFNMAILTMTVGLLFFKGAYNGQAVTALLITVPVGLLAAQVGIAVFRRLTDTAFRRLLILLTLAVGVGVLLSEVL